MLRNQGRHVRPWSFLVAALLAALAACSRHEGGGVPGLFGKVQPLSAMDSGYRSSPDDWLKFLDCWDEQLAVEANRRGEPYVSVWQQEREGAVAGRAATAAALAQVEQRLNLKLPRSYRDFILASGAHFLFGLNQHDLDNGVRSSFVAPARLKLYRDAKREDWSVWRNPYGEHVSDRDYYRYGFSFEAKDMADPAHMRTVYLDNVLYVGNFFDNTSLLLNPKEVSRDGEWEAWELSPSEPGAVRYRSFAEMLQNLQYYDTADSVSADPYPAHLLRNSCARFIPTAGLVDTLDAEQRWRFVLGKLHEAELSGERYGLQFALIRLVELDDPRAIELLLRYANSHNAETAQDAIFDLGKTHSREVVPPLLKLLLDPQRARPAADALADLLGPEDADLAPRFLPLLKSPDQLTRLAALAALQLIRAPVSVGPAIEIVEKDDPTVALQAVDLLGKLRDPRAVKPLQALRARVAMMSLPPPGQGGTRSSPPSAEQFRDSIDQAIARCTPPA